MNDAQLAAIKELLQDAAVMLMHVDDYWEEMAPDAREHAQKIIERIKEQIGEIKAARPFSAN